MIKKDSSVNKYRTTKEFLKRYEALPLNIQKLFEKKYLIFEVNQYHPSLRLHKLQGRLKGLQSFSLNRSYRVIFKVENNNILLIDIGTHSIYDK